MKLLRYYHTLKYLNFYQTIGRVYSVIKKKSGVSRPAEPPSDLFAEINPRYAFPNHDPWNARDSIIRNEFTFLSKTVDFGEKIEWNDNGLPLLWNYNLHYFDYLFMLDEDEKLDICRNWMAENLPGRGIGWSPYPSSLRIVNWIKSGIQDREIVSSIYVQTDFLSKNLEFYHPGNHYLENAKALIFAGIFFSKEKKASEWLKKGLKIFEREVPAQVLPDGVYFERTPMYHSIMLRGFLDVLNILPEDHYYYPVLLEFVAKMGHFLIAARHPNGEIALFNDSAKEIALPTDELIGYMRKFIGDRAESNQSFPDAGFYVYKDKNIHFFLDGGKIGPDELPAHSHADIFSYELSVGNDKIIVDTGVYEYQNGSNREYARSTPAHNTVSVDRTSQAECWNSFRVARRYDPEDVIYNATENSFSFSGKFGGFSRLIGDDIEHIRKITYSQDKNSITVEDDIRGGGVHLVESFIHFHPELELEIGDGKIIVLNKSISIGFEKGDLNLTKTWYSDKFGVKTDNYTALLSTESELPVKLVYRIYLP